jgi:hypothetical protein
VKLSIPDIARVVHEVNRAYCRSLGDESQVPFDQAPAWQTESLFAGIAGVLDGRLQTPQGQHEAWLAIKAAEGWEYGEVKSIEAKTHPCFLPYDELPQAQRAKDNLFRAVVEALR